ncbi:MAG TPA: hypothetical protein VMS77_00815 [Conexivisphaerales archaeon]|nr:hypothetical protein [Conexivisphaerales archaeon]
MIEALIFPLGALFKYGRDYSSVASKVSSSYHVNIPGPSPGPSEIMAAIEALSDEAQRRKAIAEAASLLAEAELHFAEDAVLRPGADSGLRSAASRSLKLGLVSDLSLAATERILSKAAGVALFQAMVARDSLAGVHTMTDDLTAVLHNLGLPPSNSLMFCRSLEEIRLARDVGLEPVVLASREHDINALLASGRSRMLMSLSEIEDMLSLLPQ